MRLELCLALAVVAGACSGDDKPKQRPDPKLAIRFDAGVAQHPSGPLGDPSGMHIDDDNGIRPATPTSGIKQSRDIEITLRSTPPGARVSVDGTLMGNTPAFCNCKADGREHEFIFMLPNHALARYRFVPVSSGVIHATLEPIAEEPDAGVQFPPEVAPPPPPVVPIAPPVDAALAPLAAPVDASASDPLPLDVGRGPQP